MPRYQNIRQVRDGNHKEIVEHLTRNNIEVIETFHPLDCLIHNNGITGWMEIKTLSRRVNYRRSQIEFVVKTTMPVAFVKTKDEAMRFASTFEGVTAKQKANLAVFLLTAKKMPKYDPAVIERVLAWE